MSENGKKKSVVDRVADGIVSPAFHPAELKPVPGVASVPDPAVVGIEIKYAAGCGGFSGVAFCSSTIG